VIPLVLVLAAMGLVGVAMLLLQPVPPVVGMADGLGNRALLAIQPAFLTLICVGLGAFAAPRAGLGAPGLAALLQGQNPWPLWRAGLGSALLIAVASAVVLVIYAALTTPLLAGVGVPEAPLLIRLLYGGVTEEIIARWGLMSLLVWLALRLLPPGDLPYWLGIVGAALLFAAGHLPLLFALVAAPSVWMIAAVILGNTIVGVGFGWLFWRYGLEAAMAAHAGAHGLVYAANWVGGRL
jgi:membrane protease YdiL (CAAX protease family)